MTEECWEVQQAWDKQNEFMKAQARAQAELRAMIKQYDEMLHKDWESVSQEQRARLSKLKAETERIKRENDNDNGDGVVYDWIASVTGEVSETSKEKGTAMNEHEQCHVAPPLFCGADTLIPQGSGPIRK